MRTMKLILFHLSCTKAQPQILSYGQINWALSLFALYDLFKCRALLSFVIFTSHVKNDLKLCEQTNTSVPSLSSPGRCYFRMKPKEKEIEPRVGEGQTHKYIVGVPGSSHA